MHIVLVVASFLASSLSVIAEAPVCPDCKTKDLLQHYKVDKEIVPLLKGNTYIDLWRRKRTTDIIDCSMTEFIYNEDGTLTANILNVEHNGNSIIIKEKWTENKGESSFASYGELEEPGREKLIIDSHVHIFFADEYVFGYFSCDIVNHIVRMAVSVRKDKESDEEALKSLKDAEAIMTQLKILMPDTMTLFNRKLCPKKIDKHYISLI